MKVPCSVLGCRGVANAAGVYCDECDGRGMPDGWSRTRDEAWLAYKASPEVMAIPVPERKSSGGDGRKLFLVRGGRK